MTSELKQRQVLWNVVEPRQTGVKRTTGASLAWTKQVNLELTIAIIVDLMNERNYIKGMKDLWMKKRPTSTKKQLAL